MNVYLKIHPNSFYGQVIAAYNELFESSLKRSRHLVMEHYCCPISESLSEQPDFIKIAMFIEHNRIIGKKLNMEVGRHC